MSTFPNFSTQLFSSLSKELRSATSHVARSVRLPSASISSASSSTSSLRRALETTSAPPCANPSASVLPIPELPPTTTATLPSKSSCLYIVPRYEEQFRGLPVEHRAVEFPIDRQVSPLVRKLLCQLFVVVDTQPR